MRARKKEKEGERGETERERKRDRESGRGERDYYFKTLEIYNLVLSMEHYKYFSCLSVFLRLRNISQV